MKKNKITLLLTLLSTFVLVGCSNNPTPSDPGFDYEPIDGSEPQGYVFNMDEKYALKTTIIDRINSFAGDYNINNIESLLDVIGDNDFYANVCTLNETKINKFGMVDGNNEYGEDNFKQYYTETKTRNNSTHTLSGQSSFIATGYELNQNINGVYSVTYDEGLFKAIEKWDYDNAEDKEITHILNDEFVERYLVLSNAKTHLEKMIEEYYDTTFFNQSDIQVISNDTEHEFLLQRSKINIESNVYFEQNISLTIDKTGYVKEMVNSYVERDGLDNTGSVLAEETTICTLTKN